MRKEGQLEIFGHFLLLCPAFARHLNRLTFEAPGIITQTDISRLKKVGL